MKIFQKFQYFWSNWVDRFVLEEWCLYWTFHGQYWKYHYSFNLVSEKGGGYLNNFKANKVIWSIRNRTNNMLCNIIFSPSLLTGHHVLFFRIPTWFIRRCLLLWSNKDLQSYHSLLWNNSMPFALCKVSISRLLL